MSDYLKQAKELKQICTTYSFEGHKKQIGDPFCECSFCAKKRGMAEVYAHNLLIKINTEYRLCKKEHCDNCDNEECQTCKPEFDKLREARKICEELIL